MINARRLSIAFEFVVAVTAASLAVLLVGDSSGLTLVCAAGSVVSVVRLYLLLTRVWSRNAIPPCKRHTCPVPLKAEGRRFETAPDHPS
jgi:hypothetical protein